MPLKFKNPALFGYVLILIGIGFIVLGIRGREADNSNSGTVKMVGTGLFMVFGGILTIVYN